MGTGYNFESYPIGTAFADAGAVYILTNHPVKNIVEENDKMRHVIAFGWYGCHEHTSETADAQHPPHME